MKFSTILGASALGVTLLSGIPAAQAQTTTETGILPTTGTREVSVAGQYVFNGDKPYNVNVGYGYFLSPSIEVGGQAGVAGASGASTATSIGAVANYYIPISGGTSADTAQNALLPFIGAFLGYSHNGGSGDIGGSDSTSYGGQGGVKYFFNSNLALDLEYDYRTARHSNGLSYLSLGISTFFH